MPDGQDPTPSETAARIPADGASRRVLWLSVLLVAVVAVGAWQFVRAGQLADDRDDRAAVATVAAAFSEALFGYDHENLDQSRDAVVGLATQEFGRTYTDAFEAGLASVIVEVEASSDVEVRRVYVADVGGVTARAIVLLDATVVSALGERQLRGAYLELTLQREDGWRVHEVSPITAAGEELLPGPPPGPEPTATPTE